MSRIALVMLASGQSRRFGAADKLMADFRGRPLASHTTSLGRGMYRYAIVPEAGARQALYEDAGWQTLINPAPERGQASSLAMAAEYVAGTDADALLICLADMPFVTDAHLAAIQQASVGMDAVMSDTGSALCPPALFKRSAFPALASLTGDTGAKTVFKRLHNTATVPLSPDAARDVDTPDMLAALNAEHADA